MSEIDLSTNQAQIKILKRVGGFAYPGTLSMPEGGFFETGGMTLRDWFAGQFASAAISEGMRGYGHLCPQTAKRTAEAAYELADAMLAERDKAEGAA